MCSIFKIKVATVFLSVLVLWTISVKIKAYDNSIGLKRWQELAWDDFKRKDIPPNTRFDAGISSNVFVEFDSAEGRFLAYAAMDPQKSWKKRKAVGSNDLLKHEQYHFNITEYFARLMNLEIENNNLQDVNEIEDKLLNIRAALSEIQKKYDQESMHSLYVANQNLWEFKIDSLLHSFEKDKGFVTDYYSGAKVFMPTEFEVFEGLHELEPAYRTFSAERYGMELAMTSYQYLDINKDSISHNLRRFFDPEFWEIEYFVVDSNQYEYQSRVKVHNQKEKITVQYLWVFHGNNGYRLVVKFPFHHEKNDVYQDIADSFIKSFEIVDTREYWVQKFNEYDKPFSSRAVTFVNDEDGDDGDHTFCASYVNFRINGFYGKPSILDNGGIIIPYQILQHPDSLVHEVLLFYNEAKYTYEKETNGIYYIPPEDIKNDQHSIDFGYILKKEEEQECFDFYWQRLELD
jgi:hypothetical protein